MALPCEMLDEILCCLPVKYLLRFRSLSKGWCSLVLSIATQMMEPLKTLISGADFVGAANGLVCVSKNQMNEFLVFNPSTRKSRKIPSAPAEFLRYFHMMETSLCGFGYDHVNDDYKVVKIAECYLQLRGIMAIAYSLKTNSWKRIQNVPVHNRIVSPVIGECLEVKLCIGWHS
ncbi:hypothetical protein POM88_034050 [Heracleum sosnowskyi]|uniref:F-box domain-containing protein n=1 Tax=Heracleum sosnowskyi TaxID=360622 RepID=A0AAD8HJN5_9APIA|nr:hypothetical protein POM88_034050 [Heracleum sosnowskyi]